MPANIIEKIEKSTKFPARKSSPEAKTGNCGTVKSDLDENESPWLK